MSHPPPLPKIEGDFDLVLDVYTHNSLRFGGAPLNDDYGDTERLAELGARIFDLAITFHWYSKRPMLSAKAIAEKRGEALVDKNFQIWQNDYGIKGKLRFAPGEADLINSPTEIRRFFHTYIGALYIRNGMPTVQTWISQLIDPDAEPNLPPLAPLGQQNWSSSMPAPPPGAPPPLPGYPPNSPPSNGVSSLVSLALVNQTAAQKGCTVAYPAEQAGPPHQPTWTVKCCVNGIEQGRGVGKSQKIAKEEAARQAWANMGWGPRT